MSKQSRQPFYQRKPRVVAIVDCACHASPILFEPWDSMPPEAHREFDVNGPIPCEGGGLPGTWCEQCRFGVIGEPEIE